MPEYITHDDLSSLKQQTVAGSVKVGLGVLAIIALINLTLIQLYFSEKEQGALLQNGTDIGQTELIREQTKKEIELTLRLLELTEVVKLKLGYADEKMKAAHLRLDIIEKRQREELKELKERLREIELKVL